MVRVFLLMLWLGLPLLAQSELFEKVRALAGDAVYAQNRSFIEIIFSPPESFYRNQNLDVPKIVDTLRENGLLDLYFKSPHTLRLTFRTNGSALFFVKLMEDTLHDMGYYRFITERAAQDSGGFVWTVTMNSEYATDPLVLRRHLQKRGCDILDVDRRAIDDWHYTVDMASAHLGVEAIEPSETVVLKRSLYAHWLEVSNVRKLQLWSLGANRWYPHVAFYDRQMRLLKVYQRDKKTLYTALRLPRETAYVKIADLYSLKNIKDGLKVLGEGKK